MRPFAWLLVVTGLVLAPTSWLYAEYQSGRAVKWRERVAASGPIGPTTTLMMHGPMPEWVDVSPRPGVLTGVGATAFGILLLAIRRPDAGDGSGPFA